MLKTLIVRGPTYFSPGDERAFFNWLQSIPSVSDVGGSSRDLHITLKRPPSNGDLREFVALLHRYRMNMKPLAAFRTPRNAEWFARPGTFWHPEVFGKSSP
jgi:hypothetical protein